MRIAPVLLSSLSVLLLAGCAMTPTASPTASAGVAIHGTLHGGQQPISGAHIYLLAANVTGYGGSGIAPSTANASLSLLTSGTVDTSGGPTSGFYYVTTGPDGSFSIGGDYTCVPGQQVYLYGLGGNPGSTANSAIGALAIFGSCPAAGNFAAAVPSLNLDEVTTIAAAYAFAGFASDALHVSSSGTAMAQIGIANAFANAGNLASLSQGTALATTPAGNATVPQTTINTLANILAACVNSTGPSSAGCTNLLPNALSAGSTGTVPTDTATAAINIAHYPGLNVAALYGSPTPISPFAPTLASQPNDFTLGLNIIVPNGYIYTPVGQCIAIDGSGNAWVVSGNQSVQKFSPLAAVLSPSPYGWYGAGLQYSATGIAIDVAGNAFVGGGRITKLNPAGVQQSGTGYVNNGMSSPYSLAIDSLSDVWFANQADSYVSLISNTGTNLSTNSGSQYANLGLGSPVSIAIDGKGNVWVPGASDFGLVEITPGIGEVSPVGGYTGGGMYHPAYNAIDSSNNIWVTNGNGTSGNVSEYLSASNQFANTTGFGSGSITYPGGIAIDGAGNVWVSDEISGGKVTELSNSGAVVSPNGYTSGNMVMPTGVAIDGSGNVWIANSSSVAVYYAGSVTELIGAAVPVVMPIAYGVAHNAIATRP